MTPRVNEPRFPLVLVDVAERDTDRASALLFDLGCTGIEVRDATTLVKGAAGDRGKETLVASFPDDATSAAAVRELPRAWNPRQDTLVGDAWRDEYKKYFHPFTLCRGLVVRPPWEAYRPKRGERVLVLEPGRAFGTGLHETTSLVCDALASRRAALRGKAVLDVGTGSGILALTALVFGASRVRAVDVDEDAVEVARENVRANGLSARVRASATPLAEVRGRYPVVLANIELGVLTMLMPELARHAAPGALVVLSGILRPPAPDQVPALLAAFSSFQHEETLAKGEWAAVVLRAPGRR